MTSHSSNSLRILAPAKVNLTLSVLGRREDGFHDLESWIVPVDLCDEITLSASDELSLQIQAKPGESLPPADSSNLVWQAAESLAAAAGRQPSVAITLVKRIPMEAGLGGGSSDAASTLLGLNTLWNLAWSRDRLSSLAERLGSDVPVFLHQSPAIIRGRGEIVEPLDRSWSGWLVLIVPSYGLSTPKVFSHWGEALSVSRGKHPAWEALPCAAAELSGRLFNDLTIPAFDVEPRLRVLLDRLSNVSKTRVHMTGSGCTLFAVFDSEQEAEAWREEAGAVAGEVVRSYVVNTRSPTDRGQAVAPAREVGQENRDENASSCRKGVRA